MKRLFIFAVLFLTVTTSNAESQSTSTAKSDSLNCQITKESTFSYDKLIFFGKDGAVTKEIQLGESEASAVLRRNTQYNPSAFGLKISSTVARHLQALSQRYGDMTAKKRAGKVANLTKDKKYVAITESASYFAERVDNPDSECCQDPVEDTNTFFVYDCAGNEILRLDNYTGWGTTSNTGKFLVVGNEDATYIFNLKKDVLVNTPVTGAETYCSDSDRFIILVEGINSASASLTIYDTKKNILEFRKVVVEGSPFINIKEMHIDEDKREILITHTQDHSIPYSRQKTPPKIADPDLIQF